MYCITECTMYECILFAYLLRTRMERENQDLALEQIRLKSSEQRVTVLESIK